MILLAVLGLVLPGYLLARALQAPHSLAAAFPLSALILTATALTCDALKVPLRFGIVLGVLAVQSLVCAVVWRIRQSEVRAAPLRGAVQAGRPHYEALTLRGLLLGLLLLGLLVRTSLFPLSGFDTSFRWDGLARLMLEQQSLAHYPPITAEDFTFYFFPDGIPPLTSTVYWWLYAALGRASPAITSVSVVLQAASCFALVHGAARTLFGATGAQVAVAVLASSSLFLAGVAMGQETGYTALSVAGQLAFGLSAGTGPRLGCVVLAALFAALGALAREYGPLLALVGFVAVAWQPQTRRLAPWFCVVALILGGPWYVRNLVVTGNPIYPLGALLGLPGNPVYEEIMARMREVFGLHLVSTESWHLLIWLLAGATLPLILGASAAIRCRKQAPALLAGALLTGGLWLWSIPHTNGGAFYSMRVLTPAWVALAIAAGALGPWLDRPAQGPGRHLRGMVTAVLVAGVGYGILCAWSHPFGVREIRHAVLTHVDDPLEDRPEILGLVNGLAHSGLPPSRVLTYNYYLAVALQRRSGFRPVMMWSPEVAFLFDQSLDAADAKRQLLESGIPLVSVGWNSTINGFLDPLPFFRNREGWVAAASVAEVETIFWLP